MEQEVDVSWSSYVAPHEIGVINRPLILCVPCQHALQADAHALNIMHRTPRLPIQQIQTNDAVRIDVRVHGDFVALGVDDKGHLWSFDRVVVGELKA